MAEETGLILVVDDNRMNRTKLSISLKQQGYTVELAEDGAQALELLSRQPFDLVLLDIIMPGIDGYQVLERMKNNPDLRHIPVIVISALDEIDSAVRCIEMGAEDYLPKPFNPVLLRARLNTSLQQKKLRDLEKAYLRQEVMLRQNEKLATLGKLSAGMAHELNNPSSAIQRAAVQMREAFFMLQKTWLELARNGLTPQQLELLEALDNLVGEKTSHPVELDALTISDREMDIEAALAGHGIENAWEVAPNLVGLDFEGSRINALVNLFPNDRFRLVVEILNCSVLIYRLLNDAGECSIRISAIVNGLKAYSFMDQAPVQDVDIHGGLDNTLAVLHNKLNEKITVHREYADDLPVIQAYGSELNQVWTNLIDNAIDAVDGHGEIRLRTRFENPWVIVEVVDSGVGIPAESQSHLFEPFFTTKPPGKGAGLGLNTSYNIVVQKHKGKIEFDSQPGHTLFRVRLPQQLGAVDSGNT